MNSMPSLAIALFLATPAWAQDFSATFRTQDSAARQALQQALADAGLYASTVDGLWGPGTARAVGAAQGSLGFAAFAAEAEQAGETDPFSVLLDYARSPRLSATLPSLRRGQPD